MASPTRSRIVLVTACSCCPFAPVSYEAGRDWRRGPQTSDSPYDLPQCSSQSRDVSRRSGPRLSSPHTLPDHRRPKERDTDTTSEGVRIGRENHPSGGHYCARIYTAAQPRRSRRLAATSPVQSAVSLQVASDDASPAARELRSVPFEHSNEARSDARSSGPQSRQLVPVPCRPVSGIIAETDRRRSAHAYPMR